MHLTALSEKRSLSTILLRRAAVVSIRKRLKRPLQLDDAEFGAFLKGLRRTKGARPVRKAALLEPNLRALVDRCEHVGELADVFRCAEEQVAAGPQRVVENRDHMVLRLGAEID
jgi:hypothetical protein